MIDEELGGDEVQGGRVEENEDVDMRCATCKMDRPPYRYGGQVNKNKNKDGDIDMAVGRAEPTIHR